MLSDISPCTSEGKKKWLECMRKQNENRKGYSNGIHVEYDMKCSYMTHSYVVITCLPANQKVEVATHAHKMLISLTIPVSVVIPYVKSC